MCKDQPVKYGIFPPRVPLEDEQVLFTCAPSVDSFAVAGCIWEITHGNIDTGIDIDIDVR